MRRQCDMDPGFCGVLTITGSGPMTDYSSNDVSPFYGRSDIRSVVIADGVETIGSYLFNIS